MLDFDYHAVFIIIIKLIFNSVRFYVTYHQIQRYIVFTQLIFSLCSAYYTLTTNVSKDHLRCVNISITLSCQVTQNLRLYLYPKKTVESLSAVVWGFYQSLPSSLQNNTKVTPAFLAAKVQTADSYHHRISWQLPEWSSLVGATI